MDIDTGRRGTGPPPSGESNGALDAAIEQIIASRTMGRGEQLKRLLAYLRSAALSGDLAALSETTIGVRVFNRRDFNPKLDTIVRSEMLRLRRKLDEYYASEGADAQFRVGFDRNSYCPVLIPKPAAPPAAPVQIAAKVPVRSRRQFWVGLAIGLAVAAAVVFIVPALSTGSNGVPDRVANHPIWREFRSSDVQVITGTALFFRRENGYERNFSLNLPEDLPAAPKILSRWPAFPVWDVWTPFEDVTTAVVLDRFLQRIGSTATYSMARRTSVGGLSNRKTIILGSPRMAPLLADLLANETFRAPVHEVLHNYGGFLNVHPKAGEPAKYESEGRTLLQSMDESMADFALVSLLHPADGGNVLSVFGDRVQTAGYLVRALMTPALLDDLTAKVFRGAAPGSTAQIVFRVDYNRGMPTGVVYLTHRVHK